MRSRRQVYSEAWRTWVLQRMRAAVYSRRFQVDLRTGDYTGPGLLAEVDR